MVYVSVSETIRKEQKGKRMVQKKERKSGIELLKVMSIFLIVLSHVTQTLISPDKFTGLHFENGYVLLSATTEIRDIVLILFSYLGSLGNLIFIVCSSYFLSDVKKSNKKKIANLWINTDVISWLFLGVFLLCGVTLSRNLIIKSIFPVTFQNNWFITIYLLFCLAVPYLNIIAEKLDQKQFLRFIAVLFVLYFGVGFIKSTFDLNNIIVFITVHFIVCYCKKYMQDFWNNKKACSAVLALGIACLLVLIAVTDFLGLKFGAFKDKQLHWAVNNNPILLLISLSLFFLFARMQFKSRFINMVSSLSLYIYLAHENILFRNYTRVYIWHSVFEKIGYDHLIIILLLFSFVLFITAAVLGYVYKKTVERIVRKMIDLIFDNNKFKNLVNRIESKITAGNG